MYAHGYVRDRLLDNDFNVDDLLRRYAAPNNMQTSIDHSRWVAAPLDQLPSLSSCTSNAGAQAFRMVSWMARGYDAGPPALPARLPAYYLGRLRTKSEKADIGLSWRDYFMAIEQFGISAETSYDPKDVLKAPSAQYMRKAFDCRKNGPKDAFAPWFRIYGPHRIWADKTRQLLAAGNIVVGGFAVDDRFSENDFDPEEPWKGMRDVSKSGPYDHAMVIVGYEDDHFRILNSWGTSFGAGGYCLFHEDYLNSAVTTHSLWAVPSAPVYV